MTDLNRIISIRGPWLTAAQIAPLYRVDAHTIRHLARAGRLPFAVDLPTRTRVRISKRGFVEWYEYNSMEVDK